jgi:hypothetical protein
VDSVEEWEIAIQEARGRAEAAREDGEVLRIEVNVVDDWPRFTDAERNEIIAVLPPEGREALARLLG